MSNAFGQPSQSPEAFPKQILCNLILLFSFNLESSLLKKVDPLFFLKVSCMMTKKLGSHMGLATQNWYVNTKYELDWEGENPRTVKHGDIRIVSTGLLDGS